MMRTTNGTTNQLTAGSDSTTLNGVALRPFLIEAADTHDVMREQLEYLIDHALSGTCGCRQCQRYFGVRDLLMELFSDL
jgi:hypothetical protein